MRGWIGCPAGDVIIRPSAQFFLTSTEGLLDPPIDALHG
jgi:hypothetical protein